jgi:hypothetical protein
MDFTVEEQRIIGIAVAFLLFELYGKMEWQSDMMKEEMQFVAGHQNAMQSVLKKVREGCTKVNL